MKNLLNKFRASALAEPAKCAIENFKLCNMHDTSLYPHLLANEKVASLNKKMCYICSSRYLLQGYRVECMSPDDKV